MWPLVLVLLWGCLLFPGCGALVGPKEISGFEGDTVSLQCTYREELRKHKKYWCKESGFFISRCSSTVYAGDDGQERTEGRVSLQDSPQELTLKVTLRKLTLQDAGKYFCGVSKLGRDESFLVSLLVFPGPCCPPSPTPSFQPLATRSLQPQAKAWQTPLPELRTLRPSTQPEPTSTEDTRPAPSRTSLSSSTGHRDTEEREGPPLTLGKEGSWPKLGSLWVAGLRRDQPCRAPWASSQPRALRQPLHRNPGPQPDFRGRRSLFPGPRGGHDPRASPPHVWGGARLLQVHLSVAAKMLRGDLNGWLCANPDKFPATVFRVHLPGSGAVP
uniref:CMRF35-like molecule 9 isoform X7 n=1 Tax=Panthera onca TaxID=9690 RepID=UPI002952E748|nr:CMRF35-like molecule 9 isoform X7 [Panthera onca]